MKTFLTFFLVLAPWLAQAWPSTNLPPVGAVKLAWDPSPDPSVSGYNLYYGAGSRQYTNLLSAGNLTSLSVSNLARGQIYFFAVTAVDAAGLESDFSPEVSYYVYAKPAAVTNLYHPVALVVQYKNSLQDFLWADTEMGWQIDATNSLFYRLDIRKTPLLAAASAVRRTLIALPPSPTQK